MQLYYLKRFLETSSYSFTLRPSTSAVVANSHEKTLLNQSSAPRPSTSPRTQVHVENCRGNYQTKWLLVHRKYEREKNRYTFFCMHLYNLKRFLETSRYSFTLRPSTSAVIANSHEKNTSESIFRATAIYAAAYPSARGKLPKKLPNKMATSP